MSEKKVIWMVIKLIIMAGCYFIAVRCYGRAEAGAEVVTAVLEGGGIAAKDAQDICSREQEEDTPQYICFWGELPGTAVLCKETGKSGSASVIVVQGNSDLVMPGTQALIWQQDGCFLDSETAWELFGTSSAAGQIVWCGESAYTVCGTFESLRRSVIRIAEKKDKACLDAVSLRGAPGGDGASQFLIRSGLSGRQIEFTFLASLVKDTLLILPLILAGILARFLFTYQKAVASAVERFLCFAAIFLIAVAVVWLVTKQFHIPNNMIPSKWSDFHFWSDWWKGQRQNLLQILGSAQGEAQLMVLWNLATAMLCNMFAIFCGASLKK